jgi:hypothetical protein
MTMGNDRQTDPLLKSNAFRQSHRRWISGSTNCQAGRSALREPAHTQKPLQVLEAFFEIFRANDCFFHREASFFNCTAAKSGTAEEVMPAQLTLNPN